MLTSILLPTLNRYEHLVETIRTLRENTKEHEIELVAMVDGDARSAKFLSDAAFAEGWRALVSHSLAPRGAIFCWNEALRLSHGDYIFCAGDDARFFPDWLTYAKRVLEGMGENACVGINDQLNARHDFSTTFLFDRKFVKESMGGVVAAPIVKYYCADNVITDLARKVGRWAYCPESVVQHWHPAAGRREADATDASHQDFWTNDVNAYEAWKNRGCPIEWEGVI